MSKKIAVVSDIHANTYALDKFLEYIDSKKVEIVLNLGDFVQIGPSPYEVSEIVLKDKRFVNILGNNETSLFEINKDNNEENNHRIWTKEELGEHFESIKQIPLEKVVNINGLKILMIHSRKNDITGMPLIYSENIEKFVEDYKEYNVDVVLFGHTHEKLYIEHGDRMFINPGSLGASRKGTADFAIIEIDNDRIDNCSFKSLKYEETKLIKIYEEKNVPDKDFLIKVFHKPR